MLLEYPSKAINIAALTKPKPDLVYCLLLKSLKTKEIDPTLRDEFDIFEENKKLAIDGKKIARIASSSEMVDMTGGNDRVILPQLLIERKSWSGGFYGCQNQLVGGLYVMLNGIQVASKLLKIENDPVVFGFVNVGHIFELWAMKTQKTTVRI